MNDYYTLTPSRARLADSHGKKGRTIKVKGHERTLYGRRAVAARKADLVRTFANKYLRLCEAEGVDKHDVREIIALMKSLDDMVLIHQRGRGRWYFSQQRPKLRLASSA